MADRLKYALGTLMSNMEHSACVFPEEIADGPFCKPVCRNKPGFYKPDYSIYHISGEKFPPFGCVEVDNMSDAIFLRFGSEPRRLRVAGADEFVSGVSYL